MRKIRIEYRKLLGYQTIQRDMPLTLDELTETQFVAAVDYYCGKLDDARFICKFLDIPLKIARRMQPYLLYRLTELADFIRNPEGQTTRFFIQNPCPDALAPLDGLRNMTFKQYMLCDTHFSAYSVHWSKESLENLFLSLYFYDKDTPDTLPEETVLMAVFFNWNYIKNYLSARFPFVFPEQAVKDKEPQQPGKVVEWLPVFDAFVGDDVAHIYDYEKLLTMDVLRIMNNRIHKHQTEKLNSKRR